MHIDFEKETEYLVKRVELAEEFHEGLSSYVYGRVKMYLKTEHLDFKRYVELANAIEKALINKEWDNVKKLVHA